MWGDKKPEAPGKKPLPQQPRQTFQQTQQVKPTVPSANAPAYPGEAKTMAPNDATYPRDYFGQHGKTGFQPACEGRDHRQRRPVD